MYTCVKESYYTKLFILLNGAPLSHRELLRVKCNIIYETSPLFRDHAFLPPLP